MTSSLDLSSICNHSLLLYLEYRSLHMVRMSQETSEKLISLAEYLMINCFSQNPLKKSNSQAHLRIVYLRALLNLLKGFARLISNTFTFYQINEVGF